MLTCIWCCTKHYITNNYDYNVHQHCCCATLLLWLRNTSAIPLFSSLLPYLHLLMDPLVSALNGSQTLVSQGLRTLELCVDNLQPDFLYEHIQPVRAQLMQAREMMAYLLTVYSHAYRHYGKHFTIVMTV